MAEHILISLRKMEQSTNNPPNLLPPPQLSYSLVSLNSKLIVEMSQKFNYVNRQYDQSFKHSLK